jgi:hypothetical protein
MNVLLMCVLQTCMLGRGTCRFFLPCIDVPVVCLAYEYVVRVFVFRGLTLNTNFISIGCV